MTKDTSSGPFIDEWKKCYGQISKDVEEVDIAPAISAAALAVKDENELVSDLAAFSGLELTPSRELCEMLRKHASP